MACPGVEHKAKYAEQLETFGKTFRDEVSVCPCHLSSLLSCLTILSRRHA